MHPLVKYIESQLSGYSLQESRDLAFIITEELTGMTKTEIIINQQTTIETACKDKQFLSKLENIIRRLSNQEPWQYILGRTEWMGLNLSVNKFTLIPRPETAELVEWILSRHDNKPMRVLDIGTGSGCIAIALKKARENWHVSGCDISEECVLTAQKNADNAGVDVKFFISDILHTDVLSGFDIIVSNPPYITEREKVDMQSRVVGFEPGTALFVPDDNPLLFYKAISDLHASNHLYFEINQNYHKSIEIMLKESGYINVVTKKDMFNNYRFTYGFLE